MRMWMEAIWIAGALVCVAWMPACGKQEKQPKQKRATVEFEPSAPGRSGGVPVASKNTGSPTVRVIVLEDKRCTKRQCRTSPVVRKLQRVFKGLQVVRHDWSTKACKEIFEREGLKFLPAFLFDRSVEEHRAYMRMRRFIVPTSRGKLKKLKMRANFDPKAEICDNGKDDTGNGLTDCKDPTCKNAVVCRPEIPKRLELFTMSQCPFGTKAADSMEEVLKAFGKGIDFRVHYIARETGRGFKSLHGPAEVQENIRQLCAIKHYRKNHRYMKYIWCRNRKYKSKDWKACTGANGIKTEVIEKCASGEEGKGLLREDIKLAKQLRVTASPTWLANNRFLFHAIPSDFIRKGLCKHNKGLKGCEKRLSTKTIVPAGSVCR